MEEVECGRGDYGYMSNYDYQVIQIDKNTYRLEEYAKTHSYLLLGSEKAMLIDTGCGCGNLYETVRKITNLQDGKKFELGGRTVEAIATPGHTTGSFCFLDSKNGQLFTADTICDFSILLFLEQSESVETFYRSVERLYSRKDEYSVIYPGHHTVPLEVTFIDDYKVCAERIMQHTLVGEIHEEALGKGLKAIYNRIGIVYKEDWILDCERNQDRHFDKISKERRML